MGYTMLRNKLTDIKYDKYSLEGAALRFIRESCEELRFSDKYAKSLDCQNLDHEGSSISRNQIPYNMEKDIDRLAFENSIKGFLKTGKKDDAFNVYFCYLEMFVGDYDKTRRMIELLSEFEATGSELLMKHRDHYSHSVYVFVLGLAIYETNSIYRDEYKKYYGISDNKKAACHYLKHWGLASLFHDIGYPFELPFEQVCSYFEVNNSKRSNNPFVSYNSIESFVKLDADISNKLIKLYDLDASEKFETTDEVFAYQLSEKLSKTYGFDKKKMLSMLMEKPTHPDKFGFFMDHAYFSATVLFKKLFCEMEIAITKESIDSITAILLHNSLYKFGVTNYKDKEKNIPFKVSLHPIAYMLMMCDELQCWDRTSYGRNSKTELHPMGFSLDLSDNMVKATYIYDKAEEGKIKGFVKAYSSWKEAGCSGDAPKLKAYSGMYIKNDTGISEFLEDIERIIDLSEIKLTVDTKLDDRSNVKTSKKTYISNSNYLNLYNFAVVLNGRWSRQEEWKKAKLEGKIDEFLSKDSEISKEFDESFKALSLEYKLTNINQARSFGRYLNEIGCFYTDKSVDYEFIDGFTEDELEKIGKLEHLRWLREHYEMGWEFNPVAPPSRDASSEEKSKYKLDRELYRKHYDMIDFTKIPFTEEGVITQEMAEANYNRLGKSEQDKDKDPMECMATLLKIYDGVRIYRL